MLAVMAVAVVAVMEEEVGVAVMAAVEVAVAATSAVVAVEEVTWEVVAADTSAAEADTPAADSAVVTWVAADSRAVAAVPWACRAERTVEATWVVVLSVADPWGALAREVSRLAVPSAATRAAADFKATRGQQALFARGARVECDLRCHPESAARGSVGRGDRSWPATRAQLLTQAWVAAAQVSGIRFPVGMPVD